MPVLWGIWIRWNLQDLGLNCKAVNVGIACIGMERDRACGDWRLLKKSSLSKRTEALAHC